ncbi:unnamed protein product [Boreogadus saida]
MEAGDGGERVRERGRGGEGERGEKQHSAQLAPPCTLSEALRRSQHELPEESTAHRHEAEKRKRKEEGLTAAV